VVDQIEEADDDGEDDDVEVALAEEAKLRAEVRRELMEEMSIVPGCSVDNENVTLDVNISPPTPSALPVVNVLAQVHQSDIDVEAIELADNDESSSPPPIMAALAASMLGQRASKY